MNGSYTMFYIKQDGIADYVTLGDLDQIIAYACAFEEAGYDVQRVTDDLTGETIDWRQGAGTKHIGEMEDEL